MVFGSGLKSVVSYPERGPYGDPGYRGNCSGLFLVDLFKYYKPRNVLDPMEGGGTCRDVCKEMKIQYTGTDLSKGVDMFSGKYFTIVSAFRPFDFIFWHPPYGPMIKYSKHERDLSNLPIKDFRQKLIDGADLLFNLLCDGGRLAILIGTLRRKGRIYRFNVDLINWREPTEPEIIKIQHNCASDTTAYSGKFIPIIDERLLIWKKTKEGRQNHESTNQ